MKRAILETVLLFLILGFCAFGAAGQLSWPMAWAVLGVELAYKVASFLLLDAELLSERAAPGPGVQRLDVIIAALGYILIYPGTLVVAGLDAVRFGPVVVFPFALQVAALLVFAAGLGFAFWAVLCNPYFSTFVRLQDDRGQVLISTGPYSLVRHPGYAGFLLAHLALPLALGSIWAFVPTIIGTLLFLVRTQREEMFLGEHLDGYGEYRARVRWRLLPGVW
jgi:protein-S-isoprenylcysteine O-methyltransferase Ste14